MDMSECLPGCQCGQHPATKTSKTPAEQREIILANLRNSVIDTHLRSQAIRSVEAAKAYAAKYGEN